MNYVVFLTALTVLVGCGKSEDAMMERIYENELRINKMQRRMITLQKEMLELETKMADMQAEMDLNSKRVMEYSEQASLAFRAIEIKIEEQQNKPKKKPQKRGR